MQIVLDVVDERPGGGQSVKPETDKQEQTVSTPGGRARPGDASLLLEDDVQDQGVGDGQLADALDPLRLVECRALQSRDDDLRVEVVDAPDEGGRRFGGDDRVRHQHLRAERSIQRVA